MNTHMIDSELFKDHYGTAKLRRIFSDEALLEKWIQVEVALAQSEAELGLIPVEVYEEIKRKGKAQSFDMILIREQMIKTSHPLVPFIRQYEKLCENGAGEYIHYGATTQDILDTALILQLRDGYHCIGDGVSKVVQALKDLTVKYRTTPMAGRTHGQHALPITLGFKLATWLSEMHRHQKRLQNLQDRVFMGQLAGAAGTLASIHESGLMVQKRMMELLGLQVPDINWHTSRDHFAELASVYAMIAGTLGKIANEIINLQRTEIAELEEGFEMGKVGSSTMPHKRNPMVCEYLVGLSRLIRNCVPLAFESMVQEHERDMGLWLVEWEFLPEMSIYLGAMLDQSEIILKNLIVNERKMRENLDLTKGLIVSERLMFFLSPYVGKQTAHEIVYRASMKAFEKESTLQGEICREPFVMEKVSREQLEACMDPTTYIGLSLEFVDRVLHRLQEDETCPI